jgi:hypothetical protein
VRERVKYDIKIKDDFSYCLPNGFLSLSCRIREASKLKDPTGTDLEPDKTAKNTCTVFHVPTF